MDVQGYECFVIAGMKQVLKNVKRMQFEVTKHMLERFANNICSADQLLSQVQEADFDIAHRINEDVVAVKRSTSTYSRDA